MSGPPPPARPDPPAPPRARTVATAPAGPVRITAQQAGSVEDLRPHRDRWRELAEATDGGFFRSWEWMAAWWEVYGEGRPITVLVAERGATPVGYLPFTEVRRALHRRVPVALPLTTIAGSMAGAADHLGPVGVDDAARQSLWRALLSHTRGASLHLVNLDPGDAAVLQQAAPRLRETNRVQTPWIDLSQASTLDELWPRKLVKEVARRERRMTELGITRRWLPLIPANVGVVHDLRRLHEQRWRSLGSSGMFDRSRVELCRRLAHWADPDQGRSQPWLQVLDAADGPVAIQLGLHHGTRYAIMKSGWSPALRNLGLGRLLHAGAITRALDLGLGRYDLLRGDEDYKYTLGARSEASASLTRPATTQGWVFTGRELVANRSRLR